MSPSGNKSDDGPKFGDDIDMSTFNQILEMDEPDDHEFSSSIVFDFFDQAERTFDSMDSALKEGDLPKLASLGHYLKGSSATLGMVKVRDGCEKIQRFGKNENLDGSAEPDNVVCLSRIGEALDGVKKDYKTVEEKLREHYNNL
jgi:osomolarity two-component system phosphorelay intermediate protein YPD1